MTTEKKIRIAIVDDHQIVIDGITAMLKGHPELNLVTTANSGVQMLEALSNHETDILLTDVMMPGMNGPQLAHQVHLKFPAIKIIALSMSGEASIVEAMIRDADISGYLLKQTNIQELAHAIRKVYDGGQYFHESVLDELARFAEVRKQTSDARLTDREKQIIQLMEKNCSNKEIAESLFISIRTVETHRKNIFSKTGCNNLLSLVKWAYEHGIIEKK